MAKEITNLKPEEISLVPKAANRRRFLLLKSEDALDEIKALQAIEAIDKAGLGEAIEALTTDDPAASADILAKSDLDEAGKGKLRAALRVLGNDLATKLLTKAEIEKAACPGCKAENIKGAKHCAECGSAMDRKPEEEAEMAKTDEIPEAVQALLKKAEDERAALVEQLAKAEADTKRLEAEKRRERFIKQAGELKHLPAVVADDFAAVLDKTEAALGEKDYPKLFGVLKSADAVIADASLFKEFGAAGTGDVSSAEAQIAAKAEDLRKADGSLTPEKARARVIKANPTLYRKWEQERADMIKKSQS